MLKLVFWRDSLCLWRQKGQWALPLSFYLLISIMLPFGLRPDPEVLAQIAPAIIFLALLLAHLLIVPPVLERDYNSGFLAQLYLCARFNPWLWVAKAAALWVLVVLPLILISPVVAILYHLALEQIRQLILALVLASPSISLICMFCLSLSLQQQSSILLALLSLPLLLPVLIFATSAVGFAMEPQLAHASMAWLSVFASVSIFLLPLIITKTVKLHLEYA